MTKLSIEVRRDLGATSGDDAAVVRITTADGEHLVRPAPVGMSGQALEVEVAPGPTRVELRLPNGHRETRTLNMSEGSIERLKFEPRRSPHEWLALSSYVSRKTPRRPRPFQFEALGFGAGADLVPPLAPVAKRITRVHMGKNPTIDVPLMSGASRPFSLATKTGNVDGNIDAIAADDAVRLTIRLSHPELRSAASVFVDLTDDSVLEVPLVPFDTFELCLFPHQPDTKNPEPAVDPEIVLGSAQAASLLGYLSMGDSESASALYHTMRHQAEEALYGKRQDPGLAVIGGYVLVSLGLYRDADDDVRSERFVSPEDTLNWLRHLKDRFGSVDGSILWATAIMQAQPGGARSWFPEVRDALVTAADDDKPRPILTMGLDLHLDGLLQVQMLGRALHRAGAGASSDDGELTGALARVRDLRAIARPREIFSTFWTRPKAP